jgi:hypothetical protein
VCKLRAALERGQSNKDTPPSAELNTSKADNSKLETQVLELMKVLESDRPTAARFTSRSTAKAASTGPRRVRRASSQFEAEIAEVEKDWKKAAKVPAEAGDVQAGGGQLRGEAIRLSSNPTADETCRCGSCYGAKRDHQSTDEPR